MCPIKDANGELDKEALADLVQVGGHFIEGGVVNFTDWSTVMREKLGGVFNEADLATIYANAQVEARLRTGTEQSRTPRDSFIEAAAKQYGWRAAAEFTNNLTGPGGDTTLLNKLINKAPLSKDEAAFALKALKDAQKTAEDARKKRQPLNSLDALKKALNEARAEIVARRKAGRASPGRKASDGSDNLDVSDGRSGGRTGEPEADAVRAADRNRSEKYTVPKDEADAAAQYERLLTSDPEPPPDRASPPTDEEKLLAHVQKQMVPGGAERWAAAIGDRLLGKVVNDEPLTELETERVGKAYEVERRTGGGGKPLPKGAATLKDALKEYRKEQAASVDMGLESDERYKPPTDEDDAAARYERLLTDQEEPPLRNDEILDKHFASALGGSERAEAFRAAVGESIYEKLATDPKSLTPAELDTIKKAFAEAAKPRTVSTPSDLAREMAPIASEAVRLKAQHEAEAKTATFETAREWFRELLQTALPAEKHAKVNADLDAVKDGDHRGLTHVYNQSMPRNFVETHKLGLQGSMLSSPGSLAVALYSHLLSAGIEHTVARGIAHVLSGGLHPGIDLGLLARAVKRSVETVTKPNGTVQGGPMKQLAHRLLSPEVSTILHSGETTLTAEDRNTLHPAGEAPRREFTVGKGGPIGNALSAVGRGGARMHGAAWHMVGAGLDEIAMQDAARFHAIDEVRAAGKKPTAEQLKARAAALRESMPPSVRDTARKLREEQIFQNRNRGADVVKKGLEAMGPFAPLARPLAPFVDVAANLGGRALEHMVLPTPHGPIPVGAIGSILKRAYHAMQDGTKFADLPSADKAALAKIAARGLLGAAIYEAGKAWAAHGGVNAPDPKRGEYGSVNVNGNKWEVGRLLGSYSGPLFQGAYDAQAEKNHEPIGAQAFYQWAINGVKSIPDNMFTELGDTYKDLMEGDLSPKSALKVPANEIAGHVPAVIRNYAAWSDPTHGTRVKEGLWDATKNSIPGIRETLPSSQDRTNPGHPYPEAGTIWPEPRHVPMAGKEQKALQEGMDKRQAFIDERTKFYVAHGYSRDGANAKARQDLAILGHRGLGGIGGGGSALRAIRGLKMKL